MNQPNVTQIITEFRVCSFQRKNFVTVVRRSVVYSHDNIRRRLWLLPVIFQRIKYPSRFHFCRRLRNKDTYACCKRGSRSAANPPGPSAGRALY